VESIYLADGLLRPFQPYDGICVVVAVVVVVAKNTAHQKTRKQANNLLLAEQHMFKTLSLNPRSTLKALACQCLLSLSFSQGPGTCTKASLFVLFWLLLLSSKKKHTIPTNF
jgi:hypothetical protein